MTRPLPVPDVATEPFWRAAREHRLALPRCSTCSSSFFPPLPSCSECGSPDWTWADTPPRGRLYSWTVIHRSGHPYWADRTPFAILMVEVDVPGAPHLIGELVDASPANLRGDERLEAVFEDVDPSTTLIHWRLAE